MQIIQLDISRKTEIAAIEAKQDDIGRKFQVVILENGEPYPIPENAVISLWYSGTGGEGNYTEIDEQVPFVVYENTVTVELISQMLRLPGGGQMCLVIVDQEGGQIGLWNIPYHVEKIPGAGSEGAKDHFSALTEIIRNIEPDRSLTVAGKPADAKTVGDRLQLLAQGREGFAYYEVEDGTQLDNMLLTVIGHMERWCRHNCVIFIKSNEAALPYGIWVFELTRTDTHVQIRGINGGMTVSRTYKSSMLKNSSFEMVSQIPGWHSSNPAVSYLSTEEVRTGKHSLMIQDDSTGAGCQVVSESTQASPGISYTATAYVFGTAECQICLRFLNADGEEISQVYTTIIPTDGKWTPITVTGEAPDSTEQISVALVTVTGATGTTYFDDVQLKAAGENANLLENPSFEKKMEIPGWNCDSAYEAMLTNESVRSGNGRCAVKLADNSNSASVQLISEPVEITATEKYAVSADFLGVGMCQLWFRFYDNSGNLLSQHHKTIIPNKSAWSHSQLSATAPVDAKKVCVALITEKSVPSCLFVDNVFLVPKEELGNYESNAERFSAWTWSGLGDAQIAVARTVDTMEHLSQLVCTTLKNIAVSSAVELSVTCNFVNVASVGKLTVYKAMSTENIHQGCAMLVTTNGDILFGTSYDSSLEGDWQPVVWSWSNPPMEEGVEYRTTERHMGKAVYTKLVFLGALPNATGKYYTHGISLTQVLRCSAYIAGGDSLPAVLNMNNYGVTVYCSREYVVAETVGDMQGKTAYAQLWYIKE